MSSGKDSVVEVCGSLPKALEPTLSNMTFHSTPWRPGGDVVLVAAKIELKSPSASDWGLAVRRDSITVGTVNIRAGDTYGLKRFPEAIGFNPSTFLDFNTDSSVPNDWVDLTVHAYFNTNNPAYVSGGLSFTQRGACIPITLGYNGSLSSGGDFTDVSTSTLDPAENIKITIVADPTLTQATNFEYLMVSGLEDTDHLVFDALNPDPQTQTAVVEYRNPISVVLASHSFEGAPDVNVSVTLECTTDPITHPWGPFG